MNTSTQPQIPWQPLSLLHARFAANLAALASRDADLAARVAASAPAEPHYLAAATDRILIGRQRGNTIEPLPIAVLPSDARDTVSKLFPSGECSASVVVGGLDQGWLWETLYKLPVRSALPNFRPPLYCLVRELRKLWIAMHVQDWAALLADRRVRIMAGEDAVALLLAELAANPTLTIPRITLKVDPALWQGPVNSGDSIYHAATAQRLRQQQQMASDLARDYADRPSPEGFRSGAPLRVLGMTSCHTTFLQYSMRDWLAGFEALGHETRLVIESGDHEDLSSLGCLKAVHEYRPDLILLIDHYRTEVPGLPANVPFVMWVQDRLPNIFSAEGGAAQGDLDFCLGFGRRHLSQRFGYPADQFLSCPVGINHLRYNQREPTSDEVARFGCDVSYVSHASATADQLVAEQCQGADGSTARFYRDVYDRMKAHYATDDRLLGDVLLRRIIAEAERSTRVTVGEASITPLMEFLTQRLNNAIVRHQSLLWLAELGIDLRLYGKGWEGHPQLAEFSRGIADNQGDLAAIYRCSRINLQVTPFGCVHQRMLDGLAAGGFFLARWSQGDALGQAYRGIWSWCEANGISNDADMRRHAPAAVKNLIHRVDELQNYDTAGYDMPLFELIRTAADADFTLSADSIWDSDYDAIAFRSRDELHAKVRAALADPRGRRDVAHRMRSAVIDRFSYRTISARLVAMIADRLDVAEVAPPFAAEAA